VLAETSRFLSGHHGGELVPPPAPMLFTSGRVIKHRDARANPHGLPAKKVSQSCRLAFLRDSDAEPEHVSEHKTLVLPLPSQSLKHLAFNYKS